MLVARPKFPPDPPELIDGGVREGVIGQLKVLAQIEALAAELPAGAKRAVTTATRAVASAVNLPKGAELRFR